LTGGTPYWFQAYAENSAGRAFGTVEPFTTLDDPTVGTRAVENVTATTADLGGNVTDDGGANVTEYGIYWDTAGSPSSGGTQVQFWTGAGPFTGPFISTVGDDEAALPTGVLVYFQAYATNTYGTTFSAIQSFTPTSAGPVQASNITFPNASGKSMRISWTRGDGDGSIVIMRQDPPDSRVDPVDGVDYPANADYLNPPPEIGTSNNFVVYKGSDDSVWVTGLSLSTTYSVAIHEYTGTGASTVYLVDPLPAEADKATTNVPVHNEDNKVNCVDCHSHGSFFVHEEELKVVCETCHYSSGQASAKLNFDNHLNPSKNGTIDFVDCGVCHELHNPGSANTTESFNNVSGLPDINKSFLRANVDKYVTSSSPPAYLHTDTYDAADPESAVTPDRAVEGGTEATGSYLATEARGYCQVCHSMTDYHRSTNTAGSNQEHDGDGENSGLGTEVNCGRCHEHTSGFSWPTDCTKCHNSPKGTAPIRPDILAMFDRTGSKHIPGGSGVVTESDCRVCHDQTGHPGDKIVGLLNADDGSIINQPGTGLPTTDTGQGEVFAENCLSCHDDGQASNLGTDDLSGTPTAGQTYTSPFTSSGPPADITPTATSWDDAGHNRPIATSGSSPVTCVGNGSNGCHGSGHGSLQDSLLAPASGPARTIPTFCYECHDGSPASTDIQAQFNTGTNFQATGVDGAEVNQRHDITTTDQAYSGGAVTCANCHRPHEDAAEEIVFGTPDYIVQNNPVRNPDTGAPLQVYSIENSYSGDAAGFTYYDGTDAYPDLDPTNPLGGTLIREPDYVEFCLVCHDGTAPAGVTLAAAPNALRNMADTYRDNDQHGRLEGRNSSSRGYLKEPWASAADYAAGSQPGGGNSTYAALNCTLCHGPHGSGNVYNLRTSITVNGQEMTVGGKEAFMDPALCDRQCDNIDNALPEFGSNTYYLPVQEQLSFGAWCTFCHEPSHGTSDGTGCQSGHLHGGGNF
jgi:hypothetical protein